MIRFDKYTQIEQDLILNNIFTLYVLFVPLIYGFYVFNLLFKKKNKSK